MPHISSIPLTGSCSSGCNLPSPVCKIHSVRSVSLSVRGEAGQKVDLVNIFSFAVFGLVKREAKLGSVSCIQVSEFNSATAALYYQPTPHLAHNRWKLFSHTLL